MKNLIQRLPDLICPFDVRVLANPYQKMFWQQFSWCNAWFMKIKDLTIFPVLKHSHRILSHGICIFFNAMFGNAGCDNLRC
jgi:hypothetical protein